MQALLAQVDGLLRRGRFQEALGLTRPAVETAGSFQLWTMQAMALRRTGDLSGAEAALRRAAALDPAGGVTWRNLAAFLQDAGQVGEARTAAETALRYNPKAPDGWLTLGRARQGLGDFPGAEQAYRSALALIPNYPDAHRELAQLIWMQTGDLAGAAREMDAVLAASPGDILMLAQKARLLTSAGDAKGAQAVLAAAVALWPADPTRHLFEANAANLAGDHRAAAALAEKAIAFDPGAIPAYDALSSARLAMGEPAAALPAIDRWLDLASNDQLALAHRATAWRMLGDARYADAYDYPAMVREWVIDTPPGWASLEAYLADLSAALKTRHPFKAHPMDQSARHGSQTLESLVTSVDPVIKAFFQAVDGPIRRHIAEVGEGRDPLRRRNTGRYQIRGAWSVWLHPGGWHVDHVHPQGWLSSACYIEVPRASEAGGHEGWIRFGQPALAGDLPAEHWVQPRPGLLVLFPSYMWHGTQPFSGEDRRLTVAFDVLPA